MNIITRMLQPRGAILREATTGTTTETETASASYTDKTANVNSQGAALAIGAYYRALEIHAQTFAQMIPEYQRVDKAGGGNFILDNYGSGRRLNWLLQVRPNPLMTSKTLLMNLELQRIQQGNGLAYLERNAYTGEIVHIWLCVEASMDKGSNTYTVTYDGIGGQYTRTVPASDVLHIRNTYSYDNGLTGVPTLVYMRNALTLEATNLKLQTENAAKGGRMKMLLTQGQEKTIGAVGKFKNQQMEEAKAKLTAGMGDDVMVVPFGTTGTPISLNATEMDILSSRAFTVAEVSRFLGVPKVLLGDASNSSYKSFTDALSEFYKISTQPKVLEFEDECDSKILGERDWGVHRIHLCERNLMRLDPTGQATLNEKLLGIGVKTINEIRKEYDQPSIEGGDNAFVTVQAQKVSDIGAAQPAAPATKEGGEE